ncbi:hypothetical protein GGP41_000427 [Bipolaris sorokiniana]|uniref:Uncharacterized protein n=1 Tax=Cochliobolus sativus TaxID=45130 RepID=A0A8H5ZJG0_COCSA|nr:hypothetical protein GGP41_000427 [Bipolaris sorokiniana]
MESRLTRIQQPPPQTRSPHIAKWFTSVAFLFKISTPQTVAARRVLKLQAVCEPRVHRYSVARKGDCSGAALSYKVSLYSKKHTNKNAIAKILFAPLQSIQHQQCYDQKAHLERSVECRVKE